MGWIGVDFDGTLATGLGGEPVPKMMARVRQWLSQGIEVRIVTARGSCTKDRRYVEEWLERQGLPALKVTDKKDYQMLQLWDDRAIGVEHDTGEVLHGQPIDTRGLS